MGNDSPSESQILTACIQWLHWKGVFMWRNNSGAYKPEASGRFIRFGYPGSADILGLMPANSNRPGVFLAVECKSAKGKLSEHQQRFGQKVTESGGIYLVARSVDDLERELGGLL